MPVSSNAHDLRKWAILGLLSLGMVIAYVDRANLSVVLASADFKSAFHVSDATRGLLNSVFFWTYALLQIPAGWIVDRYGVKRPYALGFLCWTAISAATGLITNVSQLIAARLLLGAGEAIVAPASLRWIREHCDEEQRGLAIGIYFAGTKIGAAVGVPIAAFLIAAFGWRAMFAICGAGGLLWLVAWMFLVKEAPRAAETAAASPNDTSLTFQQILASPAMWGILVGTFSYGYFYYFCVTWLPAYLVEYRHLPLTSMGWYALFSFGGMALVAVLSGWLADWMIQRGADPVKTRRWFVVIGFVLASTEVLGGLSANQNVSLFFAVFSLAGLGLTTANYWALTQTLFPGGAIGRIAGLQNFASNLAGVVAPILTGWLKQVSGGYQAPMQAIWIVLLIGIGSYIFLVKRSYAPATELAASAR